MPLEVWVCLLFVCKILIKVMARFQYGQKLGKKLWTDFIMDRNLGKSYGQILIKFSANVDNDTKNRLFEFGVDLDLGLFYKIFVSLHS